MTEPAWRHADAAAEPDAVLENNGKLDMETAHFTVPKSWIRKAPNPMLAGRISPSRRPKATKMDGRLTVSQAGGTAGRQHRPLEGAVRQEVGQGKPEDHRRRRGQDHARRFRGHVRRLARHDGAAVTRPDYRMLGAIFQVPTATGCTSSSATGREDDHRPGRRNQGIPRRSRWTSQSNHHTLAKSHGLRGLHDSRLRSQSADVLLRDHHGLRPGLQALPGFGAGDIPTPSNSARNKASSCCRRSPSFPSGRWSCSPAAIR